MRKYFILFLFFSTLSLLADNASNVRVYQDGKNIIITYDLSKASNVSVYVKSKESPNWYKLQQVTGDIGRNIVLGTNKQVVWSPLDEFDSFVGSYVQFKIETGSFANGHEYVDLGLSVKWATCNVGADSPEDYGDYFAWGEVTTKTVYDWSTYKYCVGSRNSLTKYCRDTQDGYNGFTDNSNFSVTPDVLLVLSDDVANIVWGGAWRIPTDDELEELETKCTWIWTTEKGVQGYKIIGKNGNQIFLPAAGCVDGSNVYGIGTSGYYWSSSLGANSSSGYSIYFDYLTVSNVRRDRYNGRSVRPVCP